MRHRAHTNAIWGVVGVLMLALLVLPLVGCGGGGSGFVATDPDPDPDPGPDPIENMNPETAAAMLAAWETSGHADFGAEAFRHWDEDGVVPTSCAKCHSTPGFRDFIGADGSAFGSVEEPAPLGTTVNCDACHNDAAWTLSTVEFPSGAIATGLGAEARCMTCHQGRESTDSLNAHIDGFALPTEDTVKPHNGNSDPGLRFRNVHYFAAGATLYGGSARGAYQYPRAGLDGVEETDDDRYYDARNPHVAAADTCIECHDPHTLERRISLCATCHAGVTSDADLRNIRMAGSVRDYDGDGRTFSEYDPMTGALVKQGEGIFYEIQTLQEILYAAMQQYAVNVAGDGIVYDAHAYPYYFSAAGGSYNTWTPRLLRAAYNYQYAQKDPGAFAHNPKYVIEFLYDSIADLNAHPQVTVPNFENLWRNDSGHFDAGAEAFRHWDSEREDGVIDQGDVSSSCVRCHSPGGFDFFAEYGLDLPTGSPVGDGFRCEQCHVEGADFTGFTGKPAIKQVEEITFKSGVTIENEDGDPSFLCMACHQGREAGATVDADIADRLDQGRSPRFRNIHYLPAGATIYGADAHVGYEYPGAPPYVGKWNHYAAGTPSSQCTFCHLEDHSFKPQITDTCKICHGNDMPLEEYRIARRDDYDGIMGNTLKEEVQEFARRLLVAMQAYETLFYAPGTVEYDGDHYPYFAVTTWDPTLVRAAFNYQYAQKEPGAWAHNTRYILQLLYDSIVDLGGDTSGLFRPFPGDHITPP